MSRPLPLVLALVALVGCPARGPAPAPDAGTARAPPPRDGPVTDYAAHLAPAGAFTTLRTFSQAGHRWRLVVDPRTLVTSVQLDDGAPARPDVPLDELPKSPWREALALAVADGRSLENSGWTHVLPKESGVVLMVDLCPSHRRFDRRLVERLLEVVEPKERPVPVAFAVSGTWLEAHADDLEWLKRLDGRDLAITWINHSMHHRVVRGAPLVRNFLLAPGTDARREVLDAEVAMLERGLIPSVFFRFPGLVSEPSLVTLVTALGLVPVGSDAWLAKRERPRPGSIVLVHGNGNEEAGVDDFLQLLAQERLAISARQFLLLDLRDSVAETEDAG